MAQVQPATGQFQPLTLRSNTLPGKIQETKHYLILSEAKLTALRFALKISGSIEEVKMKKEQIIQEGQIIADLAFRAEAKLGEFLKALNLRGGKRRGKEDQTSPNGSLKSHGITQKQSFSAQKIAAHPEAIDEVLVEAQRNKEIPSKYDLFKRIDQKIISEKEKTINKQFPKMKETDFKLEAIIERAIDDVAKITLELKAQPNIEQIDSFKILYDRCRELIASCRGGHEG